MERVTRKTMMGDYGLEGQTEEEIEKAKNTAINIAGKVEDWEEIHGLNPFVLLQALQNGIYYINRKENKVLFASGCHLSWDADCIGEWLDNFRTLIVVPGYGGLSLRDFGKRWALDKKVLENE